MEHIHFVIDNSDIRTCIKVLLLFSAFGLSVTAFALISHGVRCLIDLPYDDVNLYRRIKIAAIVNIIIGIVTSIVSLVNYGIVGNYITRLYHIKGIYKIFAALVMVNGVLMMGFGIYLVVTSAKNYDQNMRMDLEKMLIVKFEGYFHNGENEKYVDNFQKYYKCCGLYKPDYWQEEPPRSCYTSRQRHEKGCIEASSTSGMWTRGIIMIVVAIFHIPLAILAVYLAKVIRPDAPVVSSLQQPSTSSSTTNRYYLSEGV
ncbi:unnamed protein product [Ceutorhynchus assimilis]|uniref:Tetraspanin n=1 Tax=Ceutorhynchus assimilis TaxID=467358 RepID=A0A9N9MM26_9CUCU|nr:unnamed protein product [Ceutorhynchus assimilis]